MYDQVVECQRAGLCLSEHFLIDYQNCGRPASWNWYNVTADHKRFVFDGDNILLKLHVYHD